MNRKPLSLGIAVAAASFGCLLVILAAWWSIQVAINNPGASGIATSTPAGADTPVAQGSIPPPGSTLAPGATPLPGATAVGTGGVEPTDSDTLTALQNAEVQERDLVTLTHRLKKVTQPIPTVVNATPPSFKVGDRRTVWVSDQPNKKNFTTTATLRYVTAHVYAWAQDSERIDDNALKKSVDNFENKIYVTNRQFFGSEWSPGIDNDVHVNIFNGNVPGVGGYFSSADEYSTVVNPFSNQGEWFYINTRDVRPGTSDYEGVLAHEFQHMIHWNNDRNEDTWVNEGLSELAMQLNGYSVGGSDTSFIRDPDIQLNAWRSEPNDAVPHYGGSYLFQSYFLERFGDKVMQAVVHEPENSIAGYNAVLDTAKVGVRFDDIFQDWLIANVLNDAGIDKRYAYKNLRNKVTSQYTAAGYPYNKALQIHQYGAQYIDLKGPSRPGDYRLSLKGDTTVKIANTNPHSGKYIWYSNIGDDSDMTLTRAFDLGGLSKATLDAWIWYDIEKDFDYAYIAVSTDNGVTWDTLKSQHTTDTNPNGNSFGNAFTGQSNWTEEKFDLTPYAGKKVLVRFEYITDDAYHATGLMVDDISIPELSYRDEVEQGAGGWVADGFVRVTNSLPEKFSVQLVKFGAKTTVERIDLDANNNAQVTLKNFGSDISHAILVVSGLTPVTTQTGGFTVNVSAQQ